MRISVMFAALSVAMVLATSISAPARADAKDEFQKGCEAGHGSYGEDVNGVFCNSSGGVHIACDEGITHCTASSDVHKPPRFGQAQVGQLGNKLTLGQVQTPPSGPKFGIHAFAPASIGLSTGIGAGGTGGVSGGATSANVGLGTVRAQAMHFR